MHLLHFSATMEKTQEVFLWSSISFSGSSRTSFLPSSNADLMLDTTFTDAAALKGYSTHPAHVAVADGKVRPYTKTRVCLDFEV